MADYTSRATHVVGGEAAADTQDPHAVDSQLVERGGRWSRVILGRVGGPILALSVGLILAACVGDAPDVDSSDAVLVQGRQLYINNCIGCHGADGGGGTGPKLNDNMVEANYPDIADQVRLVAEGKDQMPAFSGKLSAEEIEAVTRYTREGL